MAAMVQQVYAWVIVNLGSLVIDAALTALLVFPLVSFLTSGWRRRANEINASLSASAKSPFENSF